MAQETVEAGTARRVAGRVGGFTWELLQTVFLTLLIFFAVRAVVQNFKVEGTSMEPTLHNNEFLIINKATYLRVDGTPLAGLFDRNGDPGPVFAFGAPAHGDIIVFKYPQDTTKDFIKRIIGVPGDTVEVRDGHVYLNGAALDEPYIRQGATYSRRPEVVPEGEYFVLGDNRPNSSDSHVWGYVPASDLIGKAWFSYWPPPEWGPLQSAASVFAGNKS